MLYAVEIGLGSLGVIGTQMGIASGKVGEAAKDRVIRRLLQGKDFVEAAKPE